MRHKSDNGKKKVPKELSAKSAKPKISTNKIKGRKRAGLELDQAGGRAGAGGRVQEFGNF